MIPTKVDALRRDPLVLPDTGESPEARYARARPLRGTPGQAYVERRGIPEALAHAHGLRFDPDYDGRPAVLAVMRDREGQLASLHGRYLHVTRGQDKMLTVGPGGGVLSVGAGWRAEPLILVEGLFDALSLALCGYSSLATVGRWAPWLVSVTKGRTVWLAFDRGRPGEAEVARYRERLVGAELRRLPPPGRAKDWNSALVKAGRGAVRHWLEQQLPPAEDTMSEIYVSTDVEADGPIPGPQLDAQPRLGCLHRADKELGRAPSR